MDGQELQMHGLLPPLRPFRRKIAYILFGLTALAFTVQVTRVYKTSIPPGGHGTMDSVAIWVAPDPNESILFITDKTMDFLEMHNPVTNTYIGRIGGSGSGGGKLDYPNGVAVAYNVDTGLGKRDLVFAVERDNNRVSAWALPEKQFVGSFGSSDLDEPYGIAIRYVDGKVETWITNTGKSPNRVFIYEISAEGSGIAGTLKRSFATEGSLESIVIDEYHQKAYICDESKNNNIMVYSLDGTFQERIGQGLFVDDPEGIVIYDMGNGDGWIICSDQNADPTEFEVFERGTHTYLGNFTGNKTYGTDGLTLTQQALPNFPSGVFLPVHSDREVHAYDWKEIAQVMNLGINVLSDPPTSVQGMDNVPGEFQLMPAWPNPFVPRRATGTRVKIVLPARTQIDAYVYNILGQRIASLAQNRTLAAGEHTLKWSGMDDNGQIVPAGVYFLQLKSGADVRVSKIFVAR